MENKNFVNIDKNILDEVSGEEAIKCVDDDKLVKRMMVSSMGECLSLLDQIDKSLKVVQSLITVAYKDDIEDYFRTVAKNVRKEEALAKQQKKDIENKPNVN